MSWEMRNQFDQRMAG
ncbi:hypothetical protein C351_00387 [Cryptococcus neoformans c8]|nr:hypothetical protein C351_00387 [Cryptococcus neoformans var. grubii c8]